MKAIWFPDFGPLPRGIPEVRDWLLFSFPYRPELRGRWRVLSSGTWGLASRGGDYQKRAWPELYNYYKTYDELGNSGWRMMPDEYLRPYETMENFQRWMQQYPDLPVVPIIQFRREREVDLVTVKEQVGFYMQFRPLRICISNPAFRAIEWRDVLDQVADMIRAKMLEVWIHVLGAGWDLQDILDYASICSIDSIDSIAYYTDAQSKIAWYFGGRKEHGFPIGCSCPACSSGLQGWKSLALHNAWVVQETIKLEKKRIQEEWP